MVVIASACRSNSRRSCHLRYQRTSRSDTVIIHNGHRATCPRDDASWFTEFAVTGFNPFYFLRLRYFLLCGRHVWLYAAAPHESGSVTWLSLPDRFAQERYGRDGVVHMSYGFPDIALAEGIRVSLLTQCHVRALGGTYGLKA